MIKRLEWLNRKRLVNGNMSDIVIEEKEVRRVKNNVKSIQFDLQDKACDSKVRERLGKIVDDLNSILEAEGEKA